MKKYLYIFCSLIFFIFTSCSNMSQEYYVILSIDTDENTVLFEGPNSFLETNLGCTISGHYSVVPKKDIDIDIEYLKSLDDSIIEVTEIDENNQCFKAITKNTGNTYIKIQTKKYHSSTSLKIYVKK